jgi:hypothetical protein
MANPLPSCKIIRVLDGISRLYLNIVLQYPHDFLIRTPAMLFRGFVQPFQDLYIPLGFEFEMHNAPWLRPRYFI